MKTNKNIKIALITVLVLTLVAIVFEVKDAVTNGMMIDWNQFTPILALITIGFANLANTHKEKKA